MLFLGACKKRILKEVADLRNISKKPPFVKFVALNSSRNAVVVGILVPKLHPTNLIYVRIIVPYDYPFKPPVDFTVLNEVIAHPCHGESLTKLRESRAKRKRTMLGRSHLGAVLKKNSNKWSPAIIFSKLLQWFFDLLSLEYESLLVSEEKVFLDDGNWDNAGQYYVKGLASPFDSVENLEQMRNEIGVSFLAPKRCFEALQLSFPLDDICEQSFAFDWQEWLTKGDDENGNLKNEYFQFEINCLQVKNINYYYYYYYLK